MPHQTPAKSILVVEDEDNIALALDFVLTREGYRHDRIADGAQALATVRAKRPDLVLLDVMLPGLSGYDIARALRHDPDLARTRILMMTARGSALDRKLGLDLGADGFIAKPFDLGELRSELRRLLAS